jgi:hypothetical protein
MNTLENYYFQLFRHDNTIIQEQEHNGNNPLFQLIYDAQSRDAGAWRPNFHPTSQTCQPSTRRHATHKYLHKHLISNALLYLHNINSES